MRKLVYLLASCLLVAPLLVQATVIELTTLGTIDTSLDSNGLLFGKGSGSNTVAGKTIKLVSRYDTDTAPSDSDNAPNTANYSSNSNWITSQVWVDELLVVGFSGTDVGFSGDIWQGYDNSLRVFTYR